MHVQASRKDTHAKAQGLHDVVQLQLLNVLEAAQAHTGTANMLQRPAVHDALLPALRPV
jgi:hypothetical protein